MIVLGINAFHADSAACLIRDGELVAAVEEERFTRIKHWAGYPARAIAYCLDAVGIEIEAVDAIAINQDNRAAFWPRLAYLASHPPRPDALLARIAQRRARAGQLDLLRRQFPNAERLPKLEAVEHHQAHLSSAYGVSPFEEAAVASIDGFGDFASAAAGVGRGSRLELVERVAFPHSLGVFYQALTQYLGFPHYGDEYKLMGLAPYGEPSYLTKMREIVRVAPDGGFSLDLNYFRHPREPIAFSFAEGAPRFVDLFTPALEEKLGPRRRPEAPIEDRHRDLAASVQAIYEAALFSYLRRLHRRCGLARLALAGGCAMNSAANGRILQETPFRELYIPPAPGDAGGAIGAAISAARRRGTQRRFQMDHAYWGPAFEEAALQAALSRLGPGFRPVRIANEAALVRGVAEAIAEGKVVGWLQGRLEWGPRALGARSILCDPRRADMKTILNAAIKRRESFRPFAPSVLRESAADWFETSADLPFMSQVVPVRANKRAEVPAITHVDGTARPQTVEARVAPRYHALIEAFRDLTGVPMLLNTSFNENEPIVAAPAEAVDCFARTQMDMLVMGDFVVRRENAASERPAAE